MRLKHRLHAAVIALAIPLFTLLGAALAVTGAQAADLEEIRARGESVTLEGSFPVKADMIATGFTMLPWREKVLLFSELTFPSQVLLVARADSPQRLIAESGSLSRDIGTTKALIGKKSLLVMERTCLDPSSDHAAIMTTQLPDPE